MIPPKPQFPARPSSPPPSQRTWAPEEKATVVRKNATGSSSRSGRSARSGEASEKPSALIPPATSPTQPISQTTQPTSASQSGPCHPGFTLKSEPTVFESPRLLPQSHPKNDVPSNEDALAAPPPLPDRLQDFEKAFPSLSEFGKQFEVDGPPNRAYPFEREDQPSTPPAGLPNGGAADLPDSSSPKMPVFPDVPSAPTTRPGLPSPPSRPDGFNPSESDGLGPPSPDLQNSLKRPASTANVSTLPQTPDLLTDSPRSDFPSEPPAPSAILRPSEPKVRSPVPDPSSSPSLSFPVAKPTPRDPSKEFTKPKFPLTNAIEPELLRSYFLNPAVDVLLLDARSEEEFRRNHVGEEYEARGAKVKVVWMDPTVLMREG